MNAINLTGPATVLTRVGTWDEVQRLDRVLFSDDLYRVDAITTEGTQRRAWLAGWQDSRLRRAAGHVAYQRTINLDDLTAADQAALTIAERAELSHLRAQCRMLAARVALLEDGMNP